MYRSFILIFLLLIQLVSFAQTRDYSNWIDFGGTHFNQWLQIAPGKLGPNALPVPDMDYALVGNESKIETGVHYHQMVDDTAINSHFSFYWNIAQGRAAVRIWCQPTETFNLSNKLRDDRQIYYDDKGWKTQVGDLFVSTYIQLLKNKKWLPDLSINYTLKTTTGPNYDGRYTDASLDYFYFALGKSFNFESKFIDELRVAGLLGFYVWQTNKVEMAQDEGPVFEGGVQLRKNSFNLFAEFGGYTGYDAYEYMDRASGKDNIQGNNDPLILRTRFEKTGKHFDIKVEYQTGFRDYHYQTYRLGVVYHFSPIRMF